MQQSPVRLNFEYSYPLHLTGYVSTLPPEAQTGDEAIRLLHLAVEEVTGKEVPQPAKQRIGFLP